jgi:DNA polymerase theta
VLTPSPHPHPLQEKAAYLQEMWSDLFIGIRTYHGEDDGAILTDDIDIAICTIEKANSLFNQLLDLKEESRIHMIVVDELHLISDDKRGFLLEVLLSKVLFTLGKKIQIVAMSATLPNISDLSQWLHGSLYMTQYRPVSLEVRVSCGSKLFKVEGLSNQLVFDRSVHLLESPATTLTPLSHGKRNRLIGDEDGFLSLCAETLRSKKSLMVFCSSKKRSSFPYSWFDLCVVVL